jgi:hypothetical protein
MWTSESDSAGRVSEDDPLGTSLMWTSDSDSTSSF